MITKINEAKTLAKHISCENSIVQYVIQTKNGIMINGNGNIKSIVCAKEIIAGILAQVFVRIVSI